jgi:hypothetical protein
MQKLWRSRHAATKQSILPAINSPYSFARIHSQGDTMMPAGYASWHIVSRFVRSCISFRAGAYDIGPALRAPPSDLSH